MVRVTCKTLRSIWFTVHERTSFFVAVMLTVKGLLSIKDALKWCPTK